MPSSEAEVVPLWRTAAELTEGKKLIGEIENDLNNEPAAG